MDQELELTVDLMPVVGTMTTERYHPRVSANFMVKVLLGHRQVMAKARDLSMAGLYLQAHLGDFQDRLTVAVPLPGEGELVLTARVCRRESDGVALEFEALDWDEMIVLARFLHPRLP